MVLTKALWEGLKVEYEMYLDKGNRVPDFLEDEDLGMVTLLQWKSLKRTKGWWRRVLWRIGWDGWGLLVVSVVSSWMGKGAWESVGGWLLVSVGGDEIVGEIGEGWSVWLFGKGRNRMTDGDAVDVLGLLSVITWLSGVWRKVVKSGSGSLEDMGMVFVLLGCVVWSGHGRGSTWEKGESVGTSVCCVEKGKNGFMKDGISSGNWWVERS